MKVYFVIIVSLILFGCNNKKDVFNVLYPEVISQKELYKMGAELIDYSHNMISLNKGDTTVLYAFNDKNDDYPYSQRWIIKMKNYSYDSILNYFRFNIINEDCLVEDTLFNNNIFYIQYFNKLYFQCYTFMDENGSIFFAIIYYFPIEESKMFGRHKKSPYVIEE